MSKIIVAIGGGENGRILKDGTKAIYNTKEIDAEIVKLTNKERPNFLFVNHAMPSLDIQESYFQTMQKIYGDIFNCYCLDLKTNELEDMETVKKKIEWADIIYEGGGDTKYMIDLWRKTGFDKVLFAAWNSGKVICGISAGAVCWFNSCNTDSFKEKAFSSLDCLNWFKYYMCPHINKEGRLASSKEQLEENNKIGILLSDCCALEIVDNNYKIIKSEDSAYAYIAYWKDKQFYQKEIEGFGVLDDLNS